MQPLSQYSDSDRACHPLPHPLDGLVVKASASRAEDPGFEFRLQLDFFRVESYQ